MGVATVLPRVTDAEMADFEGLLKIPRDRREGQLVANYDRVYETVESAIDTYALPKPIMFHSETINRTALLYFNTDEKVKREHVYCGRVCVPFFLPSFRGVALLLE